MRKPSEVDSGQRGRLPGLLRNGPTPKGFRDGTHRQVRPETTLARARVWAATAGVTRVGNVTGLDRLGIPVFAVYRPNARSLAVSQGKGTDEVAARVSGLMEAIESYHAENVRLPLLLAAHEEVRRDRPVVDVGRLPRLSVSSFDPHRRILWCEGTDLLSDSVKWVPYEMVHTDFTRPLPTGSGCFVMSSNGLASGNHPAEAVSHGLCEVIERDALALWTSRGGTGSAVGRIDLTSVTDPVASGLLERLARASLRTGLWDITSDIGVAVVVCVIADSEPNFMGQFYSNHGSGCHPNREVALLRALTEAAQTRLTYIAGARDDANREFFEEARNPERVRAVRADLEAHDGTGPEGRRFEAMPTFDRPSFEEDVEHLLQALTQTGILEVVAVNLSHREIGLPVVRVIVPGLEALHDAPGYLPGPRAQAQMAALRP